MTTTISPKFDFFEIVRKRVDPKQIGIVISYNVRPNSSLCYNIEWPDGSTSFHYAEELRLVTKTA